MSPTYRPGPHSRTFSPPARGQRSAGPGRQAPAAARKLWRSLLESAMRSAVNPDVTPLDLAHSLKGMSAESFPVADARGQMAKPFLILASAWAGGGVIHRTAFARTLGAMANDLDDLLIEQGAATAQAAMQRIGQGDD